MRSPWLALPLCVALISGACYAYRSTPVAPAAGARVRIVLVSAEPITVLPAGSGESRRIVQGVVEVRGRMEAAGADTAVVRLGELRTAEGTVAVPEGLVALVPAAVISRIEERRFQAGTTLLAGTGFAMVALGTFIVLLIVTLTKAV